MILLLSVNNLTYHDLYDTFNQCDCIGTDTLMVDQGGDFTDIELPRVIDTSSTDFVEEFYNPLLSRSIEYKRGVGYFTTNWIRSAARGIANLAENGGTAKWLTSPILDEEDWKVIKQGGKAQQDEVLRESLEESITDLRYDLEYDTRNAVAWMIADELLELRFAVPTHNLSGDFHDKFGVFKDYNENRVAFHGSQNDSEHALTNYEAYTIDCDWLGARDEEGVKQQAARFKRLWIAEDPNLEIYDIPESIERDIAELRDYDNRPYNLLEDTHTPTDANTVAGSDIKLRDYQREAVDQWFANGCRGLFQMATGTGKTVTALAALSEYLQQHDDQTITVIAVPVTHLARQWADEMELFTFDNAKFLFGTLNADWKRDLSRVTTNIDLGIRDSAVIITTHTTLSDDYFREKIREPDCTKILIGDEVHRQGSDDQSKGLLSAFDARIGLSATPERYYDEEGSEYLLDYFGSIVYEYTLSDAIPRFLSPYEYHPIIVEMTPEELEKYQEMSRKLGIISASDDVDDEVAERLANVRANIVKSAENKYNALRDILGDIDDPDHLLVYTNPDQITDVQRILNEYNIKQHKFTYEEDDDQRQQLLQRFDNGEWDALVAMRCLDEGVDVESTRQAVLMSNSGNPMQFIQRRGRVLRQADGKDKAILYDMIVVPTKTPSEDIRQSEQRILEKELDRFDEFASNALNEHEARNVIESVRTEYRV